MSSLDVVKKFTIEHYGDLINADKPIFEEKTRIWKAKLQSTYPRIIEDEQSKEPVVGFLVFKDLGIIKLDEKMTVVEATSRKECVERLSSKLELWKQESEKIVVKALSDVFAKIEESPHVLAPLLEILDQITMNPSDNNFELSEDDIKEHEKADRIRDYLSLLEGLDIVRKRSDGAYVRGNTYVPLLGEARNNPRELKTLILSYVIHNRYSALRQVFDIRQLEPYVHLANSYYSASLETDRLIHMSEPQLFQRHVRFYKKLHPWDFQSKLRKLVEEGALQRENNYLVGNSERFEKMMKLKPSVELNPIMH